MRGSHVPHWTYTSRQSNCIPSFVWRFVVEPIEPNFLSSFVCQMRFSGAFLTVYITRQDDGMWWKSYLSTVERSIAHRALVNLLIYLFDCVRTNKVWLWEKNRGACVSINLLTSSDTSSSGDPTATRLLESREFE